MSSALYHAASQAEFSFDVDGVDAGTFLVERFTLRETLSEPFVLRLDLVCADTLLDLATVVGQLAVMTSTHAQGERWIHGVVSELRVAELGIGFARYRAVVVPRIWLLSQRTDCRIFQSMSTPEILEEVLSAVEISGSAIDVRLSRDYAPRDYCVQYQETDLDFVRRVMEEEGITFFFEHASDDHVTVLADEGIAHVELEEAAVQFRAPRMGSGGVQLVQRVGLTRRVRSGKATLRDYTFKAPTTDLEKSVEGDEDADLEVYDYPGEYVEGELGGVLAQLRLEELQVPRLELSGESDARRLCPGFLVDLEEHPRDELNQQYLLVAVEHQGSQPLPDALGGGGQLTYRNQFSAIPADVPYRPPRQTRRPRIYGIQTAVVTGPSGEEIHVDEFGRVKIQFHWDRQGAMDENSSCWVRVSHGWAGAGFGQVFLPRIGQEVIVQFLEGDPDRPLITGRVYNGDNTHPYDLPGDKTRSTIKTNSSTGGGGSNELRFEDKAGSEEIYQHAQKDLTIVTENDKNQTTGNNETAHVEVDRTRTVGSNESVTIGVDKTKDIGSNETITIGSNLTMDVGANQTETVGGNKTQTTTGSRTETVSGSVTETVAQAQTTTIGIAYTETVGAAKTVTVGAAQAITVGATHALTVGASMTQTVGASQSTTVGATRSVSVGGNQSHSIGGNQNITVGKKRSVVVADQVTIACGDSVVVLKKDGTVTINGKDISLTGKGDIQVDASGKVKIKAKGDVQVEASGNVKVKGSKVNLN